MHVRGTGLGIPLAITAAVVFASVGPFSKLLLETGWSPGGVVMLRVICASLLLLPLTLWSVRRDPGVLRRRWLWILAYGVVALCGCQVLYMYASARLPVAIALLIQFLAPVLILFAVWGRTRIRPAWLALIGAGLAVAGLVLVLGPSSDTALDPLGLVWAGLAAVSLAVYFLLGANTPGDLPPIALIGSGLLVSAVVLAILGTLGLVPMRFVFSDAIPFFGAEAPWWVPLGLVVVLGTVFGYVLGLQAAIKLGSRLASFLGMFEILVVVLLAALLLGEVPTLVQLGGAIVLVAGVIAVRLAPDRAHVGAADPLEAGPVTAPIPIISAPTEDEYRG
ncbi:EamA family transporter [Leucobacter sp. GX24907]